MSSDAFSIDSDGDGYCFSGNCKQPVHNKKKKEVVEIKDEEEKTYKGQGEVRYTSHRGLSESTIRFYDIKTKFIDDTPVEVAFPWPKKFLIRNLETGKRRMEGETKTGGCFGVDKFDPGSKDSVTIVVGDWDAPSIYEATRGKTAAISAGGDQAAKRNCIIDRDFINSFNKIILCFDNDDSGQKAAKEIAPLFDFNKLYHVKLTKYKDASDYFQKGEVDNLEKAWNNAKRYSPDNIISTFSEIQAALKKSKEDQLGTYPFATIQAMTYGLHAGEVVVFKGFEKIGKTEIFRAIEHHLLKTTKHNIGIIHLEEDNGTTIKGIAGYELGIPAMLPDSGLSEDDIFKAYKQAVNDNDSRVHLYQSFETEDEELFLDGLRFLAAAAGCKFIFLDHISWLATGKEDDDERKKLDRLSQKIKLLAKELGICILMISHTNDEGKTRGSRNITKVANTIVHMDRDKMSPDERTRRTTKLSLEGVRLGGQTGPAGEVYMNPMTAKLEELTFEQRYPTDERMKVA